MMKITRTNSDNQHFHALVRLLDEDLWKRYPLIQGDYAPFNKIENLDTIVVAYMDDEPVGCGCFKKYDETSVEVKRMFVREDKRGNGIASSILNELEQWAKELSFSNMILETGDLQHEAIELYKKLGYEVTEAFGPYVGMSASICFKKKLQ